MSAHLFLNSPLFSFLSPKHRIQHIRQWFHGIQYFLQRIGLCSRLDEQRLWRQMEIIPQTFEINISGKSRIILIAGKFQLQSQSQIVFDIRIMEVFDRSVLSGSAQTVKEHKARHRLSIQFCHQPCTFRNSVSMQINDQIESTDVLRVSG